MKLIVHIGAGKTGSSSIQNALAASTELLADAKMRYLGMMFENAPRNENLKWQFRGGSDLFFAAGADNEVRTQQLLSLLRKTISKAEGDDIETLIWSNEMLLDRSERVVPALEEIKRDGHEILIVCYVRRHDTRARSAYVQWGIKHKTYPGPILPFDTWEKNTPLSYAAPLNHWVQFFQNDVVVMNYDKSADVTQDFFSFLGLALSTKTNANKSPENAMLALMAVFNNMSQKPIRPEEFMSAVSRNGNKIFGMRMLPSLQGLLPSTDQLGEIRQKYEQDINQINHLLEKSGQPILDFTLEAKSDGSLDLWQVNQLTLQLVFLLMARVDSLEALKTPPVENGIARDVDLNKSQ